ncbi:MAG: hypothetical protein NT154_19165, partial [Verrucomicrobia bacterium]|nr:hypothetical protein [Verrucomicrobiota bacterium]
MKISLCMIVGKAQEYIERCLTDFAPLADEVCLVRAIGSQKPDATIEKAELLLKALGKPCRVADYLNQPGHRDWPHIDDFAAARQMSFDLASGEYCFWCDTDDVLDKTPVAGQSPYAIVREIAERGGWSAFMMPYRIFGRGVSVPRERMISRLAGKWIYPVHESFKFHLEPAHAVEENRVVVVHMPHLDKKGSSERNLRILKSIPDKDLTAGLLYHLQGELSTSGDIPGSIKVAERALKHPDLGRPEKYELFLNLAQMSTTPEAKEAMLIQAYATDPRRREALGILACTALDYGKNDRAMAYARQMMSVLPLTDTPWNDRAAAYGWLGDEIYTQALRANGFGEQAEIVRREMVKRA